MIKENERFGTLKTEMLTGTWDEVTPVSVLTNYGTDEERWAKVLKGDKDGDNVLTGVIWREVEVKTEHKISY